MCSELFFLSGVFIRFITAGLTVIDRSVAEEVQIDGTAIHKNVFTHPIYCQWLLGQPVYDLLRSVTAHAQSTVPVTAKAGEQKLQS